MNIEIRKIDPKNGDHVRSVNKIAMYSFHPSPSTKELKSRLEKAKYREESDQFLLYENGDPVASATIHPMTQNVRNRIIQMGGVATVGTMPHARRKGYVSKLMLRMMDQMKENNQSVSVLHPFRESFYERYGYVALPDRYYFEIKPQSLSRVNKITTDLTTKLHEFSEVFDDYKSYWKSIQSLKPGMVMFTDKKMEQDRGEEFWALQIYDKEELVGIVIYEMEGYGKPLVIHDMLYHTISARYEILKFLLNHTDHASKINISARRDEYIDRWLSDIKFDITSREGAMVRVIDIEQLNGLDLRVGTGKVIAKINDDHLAWNNGMFEFISVNNNLVVNRLEEGDITPEVELNIRALSALIYGYYNLEELTIKDWAKVPEDEQINLKNLFPEMLHEVTTYF